MIAAGVLIARPSTTDRLPFGPPPLRHRSQATARSSAAECTTLVRGRSGAEDDILPVRLDYRYTSVSSRDE